MQNVFQSFCSHLLILQFCIQSFFFIGKTKAVYDLRAVNSTLFIKRLARIIFKFVFLHPVQKISQKLRFFEQFITCAKGF